jgi:hypothetical protein
MRAFLSWATSVVFVFLLVGILYFLAHKQIPGFPDEPEKNVTLVPSSVPPGEVSLVLEPPMATRQIQGQSQELALQFSNKSKRPVELIPARIKPSECLALDPPTDPAPVLKPGETALQIYQLRFLNSDPCVRETPVIFIYGWRAIPAPVKASKRSKRLRNQARAASPAPQQRSIATTPVRITSDRIYYNERFVRIGQLVLLPVILAILTFIFQRLQAARDEAQSEQNLRIEVWKIIHPTFLSMVKTYYAPLVRRMGAIEGLIGSNGTAEDLFVLLLLLRRQMLLLLEKDAGYYFQSKPGEDVCGILNDALVNFFRARLNRDFDNAAILLSGSETPEAARPLLVAGRVDIPAQSATLFATGKTDYPDPSAFIAGALKLFVTVLAFESDRPFDSVWYDESFSPKIRFSALNASLSYLQEPDQAEMRKALNEYSTSIPWRCVADKSPKLWLQRLELKLRQILLRISLR